MDDRIGEYIRANRDQYTRESITEQLIAAGHDPARVDAAWGAIGRNRPAEPPQGRVRWVWAMLLIGGLLSTVTSISLLTSVLGYAGGSLGPLIGLVFIAPPILYFVIGRLVARRVASSDALRHGGWIYLGCAIPAIFLGLAFGSCLAASFLTPLVLIH